MIYLITTLILVTVWLFYRKSTPEISPRRKLLLYVLRSISLIIIAVLLVNPVLSFVRNTWNKPRVLLFIDNSRSMDLLIDKNTKKELLKPLIQTIKDKYSGNFEVEEITFADGVSGSVNNTNFIKAVEQYSKSKGFKNVQEIYLLSDGWFREESLLKLSNLHIPVHTINIETKTKDVDLQLSNLILNKTCYKNEITPVIAELLAKNYAGKAVLEFYADDQLIEKKSIDFSKESFQRISLDKTFAKVGLMPLKFRIVPVSGEINSVNNIYPASIQVLDNKSKIIIISDKLNWDVKFFNEVINLNEHWTKNVLLSKNNGLYIKSTKINLELKDKPVLLIILNNGTLNFNPADLNILRSWFSQNTGLIFMGKPQNQLLEYLPGTMSNIANLFKDSFKLTNASKQYELFRFSEKDIQNIPPLDYYYIKAKNESQILAEFSNEARSPAIVYSDLLNRKSILLPFYNLWKWQLWDENNNYRNFIMDLISWISSQNTDRFHAYSVKNSYFSGESAVVKLSAFDEKLNILRNINPKIRILQNNKEVYVDFLNPDGDEYKAEVAGLKEGKYSFIVQDDRLKLSSKGEFLIHEQNAEQKDLDFNSPLLSYISKITDGKSFSPQETSAISPKNTEKIKESKYLEIPLYRKWYFVGLFIICFCLELFFRKRWGLL